MAFPTSPIDGQVAVQNGIRYTYSSATNSWTRNTASSAVLSYITDNFIGDGSSVSFTLSTTPLATNLVEVNIDGVSQLRSAFTVSGNTITFTGTPVLNATIEVRTLTASGLGVLTGLVYDNFTGNGSTTAYTLSTAPTNKNFTLVTIGGVTQEKSKYNVSGTTLTFTTAPLNGEPIEVMTFGPAVNTSTPNTLQNGTSSVNVLRDGNVTISSAGTSNVFVVSNTTATLNGGQISTVGKSVALSIVFGA